MGNCLVTKLKSVVDNDMLYYLGNTQIEFSNPIESNCAITGVNGQITAVIKTDHVFTDPTHTQDLGKTITMEPGVRTSLRFNGSSSPVIFEIGPIKNIRIIEGDYPLSESSYGYSELQHVYCVYKGSIAKVGTLFENLTVLRPHDGAEGNITDLISATKLISAKFVSSDNNNVVGRYEDFLVPKYQQGLVDHVSLESNTVTFHDNIYEGVLYAGFSQSSPYITVRQGDVQGTILGTWDGTSWTYA